MSKFSKIKFGSGLAVTDEGAGVITVSGSGGSGGTGPAGPPGPTGPTGPAGPNVVNDTTASPLTGMLKANGTDVDVAVAGTDYATPAQLSAKVDRDAVEIATARLVQVKLAAGDTQPAFKISGDGKHEWGGGGSTAPDTTLYRSATNRLRTPGSMVVDQDLFLDSTGAGYHLHFGGGTDCDMSRTASGVIGTPATFSAATHLAQQGLAGQTWIGNRGPSGEAGIAFGSASDTLLYRSAAGVLKTNGNLNVVGQIHVGNAVSGATGGIINWKVPIYRSSDGVLLGYMPLYST